MDSLIEHYRLLNDGMSYSMIIDSDLEQFQSIANKRLKYFFSFDYANPHSTVDLLIVGCILEYPIESTLAVINELI
jgi:hypothetical protein